MAEHNRVGKIGEDVACKYLRGYKFLIMDRNYRKKWGEIDIIVWDKKEKILHFVEVKSVSCENLYNVSRETEKIGPEEKVDNRKKSRMKRAIQTYITEKKLQDFYWQVDILVVFLNLNSKKAKIRSFENVII